MDKARANREAAKGFGRTLVVVDFAMCFFGNDFLRAMIGNRMTE